MKQPKRSVFEPCDVPAGSVFRVNIRGCAGIGVVNDSRNEWARWTVQLAGDERPVLAGDSEVELLEALLVWGVVFR